LTTRCSVQAISASPQPKHLGLLAVPFVSYLLISVPINGLFVTGFVLTGRAIFEGQIGLLIAGISILLATTLAVKMIRRRLYPAAATARA
jgi:hypothetical protein